MDLKPDTVSLREIVVRKRYNEERCGDPERFRTLWALISEGFTWAKTPEGGRFWVSLRTGVWRRLPKAEDVVLQNKPWQ